jgi:hypothetical protein
MVKQKKSIWAIPQPIAIGSIIINALLVVAFIVGTGLENSGTFDSAIVNNALARMCSDHFRQSADDASVASGLNDNDRKLKLALVDFPCSRNGADVYYKAGYQEYAKSLGLTVTN